MRRPCGSLSLLAALLAVVGVARADDKPKGAEKEKDKVDAEFLEFLGSFDGAEDGLLEFLASEELLSADTDEAAKTEAKRPKVNSNEP